MRQLSGQELRILEELCEKSVPRLRMFDVEKILMLIHEVKISRYKINKLGQQKNAAFYRQ